jgi:hypothetical protein
MQPRQSEQRTVATRQVQQGQCTWGAASSIMIAGTSTFTVTSSITGRGLRGKRGQTKGIVWLCTQNNPDSCVGWQVVRPVLSAKGASGPASSARASREMQVAQGIQLGTQRRELRPHRLPHILVLQVGNGRRSKVGQSVRRRCRFTGLKQLQ